MADDSTFLMALQLKPDLRTLLVFLLLIFPPAPFFDRINSIENSGGRLEEENNFRVFSYEYYGLGGNELKGGLL